MIETLQSIRITELVDLAVVWIMVWAGIAWLRTAPARLALAGLGILVAVYLVASQLGLVLTTWILQSFAAVAVLVAVVVFQEDLRRLFEQIAAFGLRRGLPQAGPDTVDTLARTIANLAEHRRGALFVVPGREPVERHVEGGVACDARITEPLLLSIFDPHSPGHDGAVVVNGDRLSRFAVHLPLSTDHAQLGQRGTRHAAALGLAERTDALSLAVSEERGTVSVGLDGHLRTLPAPQAVAGELRRFLERLAPAATERPTRLRRLLKQWREALLALPIAGLLWFLAIPGGTVIEVNREARVTVNGLPPGYEVESVDPERVVVTVAGRRRDLYLLGPDAIEVRVDAILVELGRRTFPLTPSQVEHPDTVEVRAIHPDRVRVSLRKRETGEAEGAEAAEAAP
jgi:diadenylate cyclase